MNPVNDYAASSKQVTTQAAFVTKIEWRGGASVAAGRFIQIHDSATVPAEAAVPKKSYPIDAATEGYKLFEEGEVRCDKGVYVCVSTTEATKTIASGNDIYAMLSVEMDRAEEPSVTYVGDLTSNVQGLEVWADSAGPKRLVSLEVDGSGVGSVAYLMIFANDSPAEGETPIFQRKLLASTAYTKANGKEFSFGKKGVYIKSYSSGTLRDGCTVKVSTTSGTLTTTASNYQIKAAYVA